MSPSFIETKIQEDSLPVNNFFKFLFAGVGFFGVKLAGARIHDSPEFSDFDHVFHTSSTNLPRF